MPPAMITVTDLAMGYGAQTLFTDVNLQLDRGRRYGIVGANGAGKSSLLRVLSGEESPTEGEVRRPKGASVGVLEQDHFALEEVPILDVVMMGNAELWGAMVEKEALLSRAETEFDDDRYSALEDIVMRFDGYGLEARAGEVLEGLGIPSRLHREPLRVLSGGYKLRALMARTLAASPDVLLLDEPTNHLDILAIRWLEDFLARFRGLAVVVSHDHHFLDRVCTHTLDVDYERVTAYRGNYTAFTRQKVEERARREAEINKREKEIADHRAFITRFKAKATKARQANSRQKRMEKIVIDRLPQSSRRHPKFSLTARRQSGREVLRVRGLWKAFGDNLVLGDVSFDVHRGERVAIIGPNGVGKSTLLRILIGEIEADEGAAAWGYEADWGYFPQDHREALPDPTQTVLSALWDACPTDGLGQVLGRAAAVLFAKDDTDKKVVNLSGGEAARLIFAKLGAVKPTVLVLDEPTNHLDLEGIESLAAACRAYDGTLLFVSHDRWFVGQVATRIIELKEDGVDDFPGTYAEFVARMSRDHLDAEAVVRAAQEKKRAEKKKADKKKKRPAKGRPEQEAGAPAPQKGERPPRSKRSRRSKRRRS